MKRETCAVLIMDMSGFSEMSERQGIDVAIAAIERFRTIARGYVASNRGTWVKAWADNFVAVFPSVRNAIAVAASVSIQVPSGAGIGWGETLLPEGDLWGVEVNRAARLGEDTSRAGEILLTDAAVTRLREEAA